MSIRCLVGRHEWFGWITVSLSKPTMQKRVCFRCPRVEWRRAA